MCKFCKDGLVDEGFGVTICNHCGGPQSLQDINNKIAYLELQLTVAKAEKHAEIDRLVPFDVRYCETGKCTKWCGLC